LEGIFFFGTVSSRFLVTRALGKAAGLIVQGKPLETYDDVNGLVLHFSLSLIISACIFQMSTSSSGQPLMRHIVSEFPRDTNGERERKGKGAKIAFSGIPLTPGDRVQGSDFPPQIACTLLGVVCLGLREIAARIRMWTHSKNGNWPIRPHWKFQANSLLLNPWRDVFSADATSPR
jgi:hypothetical protein